METIETPIPRQRPAPGLENERILIVDDDPVSANLAARILGREGYDCEIAEDGDRAWQLLGPDVSLVLLDVMMPRTSGLEVLRRMRTDPILAAIPVLLATGVTDPAIQIRGVGLGAQGIVPKPIRRQELVERVRRVLGRTSSPGRDATADTRGSELPVDLREIFGASPDLGGGEPTQELTIRQLLAERDSLYQRLDAGYRLLSAIVRLHQMIGAGLDPDRVADGILKLAEKVLDAEQAILWVPDGRQLHPLALLNAPEPAPLSRDSSSLPARVTREWSSLEDPTTENGLRWFHFPLSVASEGVGVLSLRLSVLRMPSRTLCALYCAEAATALDASLRLRAAQSEALTDPLTGLLNRRGLEHQLGALLRRAHSVDSELGVLFVDLDHFKTVNDELGHDRGDALLRRVGEALRQLVRTIDVVARYGGDEFVIVLPASDPATAVQVAERVREGVAAAIQADETGSLPITATIGIANLSEGYRGPEEIVAAADRAMLHGKTGGRNRIATSGARPATPTDGPTPSSHGAPQAVRALLGTLASHHPDSGTHSAAVAALSARVARRMGCSAPEIRMAGQAGVLHDIGKLYLPLEILDGTGPLSPAERALVDQHTITGAELVASFCEIRHLAPLVHASQEHFDGGGYPAGLAHDEIPLVARIIAVTDAYHAMASDRPYRKALAPEAIRAELRRFAGTQFDPAVVDALLDLIGG